MDIFRNLTSALELRNVSFRGYCTLLLVLCALASLLLAAQAAQHISVTGETVYAEAGGVLTAQRWAKGLPMYEDYRHAPYLVTSFPPLWYALVALPARFGYQDLDTLTVFGRLLSLAAVLGLAALMYIWGRKLGYSTRVALIGPALYLSFPLLVPWAVTARPDFPAILLVFAGLYWASSRNGVGAVCVAGVLCSLAFVMRHNVVAVPVVIVLWLAHMKRWKDAMLFCLVWTVGVVVSIGVFRMPSLELFQLNLSAAKFGKFAITYIRDVLARLLSAPGNGFAVLLAGCGLFAFLVASWKDRTQRLLRLYVLVTLGLALFGTAAAGGGINHYLEPAAALAMLAPAGFARLEKEWMDRSLVGCILAVLTVISLLPSLDMQRFLATHNNTEKLTHVALLMGDRPVFTDIPYLATRKKSPELVDLASLMNSEVVGGSVAWSSNGAAERLRRREYELVILVQPIERADVPGGQYPRAPRLDLNLKSAIRGNYKFCSELDSVYVYSVIPKDGSKDTSSCGVLTQAISQMATLE